ncbi:hypothetical protein AYL99_06499 [Fonsecaea erecta]|uniref:3-hydroxybutyrate dehydrogenase n=1 Tax=Fonsecaea erecta TaxID=1367422 RepID=A0A178ZIA1_9EURO|nr:hypothetical protein AYL99_06499 [Fonsecaea erecta]OAP59201.1 hypothetical protein AYL99_06499 [Fonsecaea erecta]
MAFTSVDGKVAIVTGAGSGINLAFADLLLSQGCSVLFADLALRPEAQALVESHSTSGSAGLRSDEPRIKAKAFFQKTDVRSWADLERMFETCDRELGPADIVCPGAGVYEPAWSNFWIPPGTEPSKDSPTGNRYASFDILLTHPVRTTQLAISHFIRHEKPGNIVHISSIAAQSPGILCVLYRTAKHAISGFVRSLAKLEVPGDPRLPTVRVTAVAPGVIKTPMWLEQPDKMKWVDEDQDAWVSPEEVARVMLDLVQKPEFVGGTVLEVLKGSVRRVETLNDPGPRGKPGGTLHPGDHKADVWDRLASGSWGQI